MTGWLGCLCNKRPMTDNTTPSSGFPPSFLTARERANIAADAERGAWEALARRTGTGQDETHAWRKAHEESRAAQDAFADEVKAWFSRTTLD
jgi:predicted lipoprotein